MIHHADCLDAMREMEPASVDAIVTDPPYGLGFMGKRWDALPPGREWAEECLRVLKPGGHLLAFGGTRTYHRLACAIEDAGFEIRDMIAWLYGSGFPKSHDVAKAIDKAAGAEREVLRERTYELRNDGGYSGGLNTTKPRSDSCELTAPATPEAVAWQGWGTALKPAHEPIVLARKPLAGTVSANVLEHGTGALNVDGCRVEHRTVNGGNLAENPHLRETIKNTGSAFGANGALVQDRSGRWPANVVLDREAADLLDAQTGDRPSGSGAKSRRTSDWWEGGALAPLDIESTGGDSGGASRFFYCAKASRGERNAGLDGFEERRAPKMNGGEWRPEGRSVEGTAVAHRNTHPTVKPLALMRWLVRLVTPPGGLVLDPFCGSGTTGCACALEGFDFVGIEREAEYVEIARARIAHWTPTQLALGDSDPG